MGGSGETGFQDGANASAPGDPADLPSFSRPVRVLESRRPDQREWDRPRLVFLKSDDSHSVTITYDVQGVSPTRPVLLHIKRSASMAPEPGEQAPCPGLALPAHLTVGSHTLQIPVGSGLAIDPSRRLVGADLDLANCAAVRPA